MSKPRRLTDDELVALYAEADEFNERWHPREDIALEMRGVVDAPTLTEAAAKVEWWGGWGQYQRFDTAMQWARDFRARAVAKAARDEVKGGR